MNIPQNHVALLMELCYTEPEARFLYVVATHSGYFILRQFLNFIDAEGENDPIYLLAKSSTMDTAQSEALGQWRRRRNENRRIGRLRPAASSFGRASSRVAAANATREGNRLCVSVDERARQKTALRFHLRR